MGDGRSLSARSEWSSLERERDGYRKLEDDRVFDMDEPPNPTRAGNPDDAARSKACPASPPPELEEENTNMPDDLYSEISPIAIANAKFTSFPNRRIRDAAYLLERYGIDSPDAFRTDDAISRRYLIGDLGKPEQISSVDIVPFKALQTHTPK